MIFEWILLATRRTRQYEIMPLVSRSLICASSTARTLPVPVAAISEDPLPVYPYLWRAPFLDTTQL